MISAHALGALANGVVSSAAGRTTKIKRMFLLMIVAIIFLTSSKFFFTHTPMTPEERQLVNDLCTRIADEKDPSVFCRLVQELDALLARKEKRLEAVTKTSSD